MSKMLQDLARAGKKDRKRVPRFTPADPGAKGHPATVADRTFVGPVHSDIIDGGVAAELDHALSIIQRLRERVARVNEEYRSLFPRIDLAENRWPSPEKVEPEQNRFDDSDDLGIEELEELIFIGRAKG